MPTAPRSRRPRLSGDRLAWIALGGLLAALVAGAATFDRAGWPGLVGDEATYLMQAQSLAFDGDLAYGRGDYDRFVALWGRAPEGLILQSADRGRSIAYGKPASYAVWLAPFVRLAPRRGPAVANALLLAAAALAAAAALRRSVGPAAPGFAAAWVFASVAFAHVFWVHADLFLMSLTALGLAAVFSGGEDQIGGRRDLLLGAVAGALLVLPALARPFYGTVLVAAGFAAPAARRHRLALGLALGAVLVAGVSIAGSYRVHGTWTSYDGERLGFYSSTGFPAVDFPAEEGWNAERARRPGSGSWVDDRAKLVPLAVPDVWAWDALYLLAGRDVGLLPYFLPGFALALAAGDRRRWPLLAAAAATAAAFVLIRPFNFWGGGGALANRYFLPVYPALWFLAARPRRALWPIAAALAAAPFLLPLWSAPRAFPWATDGALRHVSATARALLPYETTQDHLKPTGGEDLVHQGLWIKPLWNPLAADGGATDGWLAAGRPGPVELLVGSPTPLAGLRLELPPGAVPPRRIGGAGAEPLPPAADGTLALSLTPRRVAKHRMWWAPEPWSLYRIELAFPIDGGAPAPRFRLRAATVP